MTPADLNLLASSCLPWLTCQQTMSFSTWVSSTKNKTHEKVLNGAILMPSLLVDDFAMRSVARSYVAWLFEHLNSAL
jgi:hypothetical protein